MNSGPISTPPTLAGRPSGGGSRGMRVLDSGRGGNGPAEPTGGEGDGSGGPEGKSAGFPLWIVAVGGAAAAYYV